MQAPKCEPQNASHRHRPKEATAVTTRPGTDDPKQLRGGLLLKNLEPRPASLHSIDTNILHMKASHRTGPITHQPPRTSQHLDLIRQLETVLHLAIRSTCMLLFLLVPPIGIGPRNGDSCSPKRHLNRIGHILQMLSPSLDSEGKECPACPK